LKMKNMFHGKVLKQRWTYQETSVDVGEKYF